MTQLNNAGIRRNRRKAGEVTIPKRIFLTPETQAAFDEARIASGSLSYSLYLERLVTYLASAQGALPVLSKEVDLVEVQHTDAA
jgi:hypothetical protein